MKSQHKAKLSLNTETLRTLSASELAYVEGGFTNVSDSCSCNSLSK